MGLPRRACAAWRRCAHAPGTLDFAIFLAIAGLIVLAGLAVLAIRLERLTFDRLARALGALTLALGAATLNQNMFGWDLGIDTLRFDWHRVASATSGRMAPSTAPCFALSGAALAPGTCQPSRQCKIGPPVLGNRPVALRPVAQAVAALVHASTAPCKKHVNRCLNERAFGAFAMPLQSVWQEDIRRCLPARPKNAAT
ncbi:MAG: hypothetical protein ACI83P_000765 [Janthinobacterium sp.]